MSIALPCLIRTYIVDVVYLTRFRFDRIHSLRVTTSIYPVPSICAQDQISDWFDSLAECLHWNVRKGQKSLDDVQSITEGVHQARLT